MSTLDFLGGVPLGFYVSLAQLPRPDFTPLLKQEVLLYKSRPSSFIALKFNIEY